MALGLLVGGVGQAKAQPSYVYTTKAGEWPSYAGDVRGSKYSPLDQITADNFGKLEIGCVHQRAESHYRSAEMDGLFSSVDNGRHFLFRTKLARVALANAKAGGFTPGDSRFQNSCSFVSIRG